MIPGDLAIRLRSLLDNSLQPLSVSHAIPSDMPRFEAGERFSAQIQNPLPDGSFRALVAGKTITLALPESAKNGDVMELVVTGKQGTTIQARQVPSAIPASQSAGDVPKPILSQTGRLISQLLTGRFGEPEAVALTKGTSLLPAAPQNAAELVPALKQAVSSSGLFYESHLRQWVEGKLPLPSLLQEPQAQQPTLPDPAAPLPETRTPLASAGRQPLDADGKPLSSLPPAELPPPHESVTGKNDSSVAPHARAAQLEAFADQSAKTQAAKSVAETLMPLVQQQLETLASHQMSWQGQMWPGMQMQWDLTNPDQQGSQSSSPDEQPKMWRSALRLQLPRLGDINAQLVFGPQGLAVHIDTNNGVSAERMRVAQTQLLSSLEAAGVTVIQMQVSEHASA